MPGFRCVTNRARAIGRKRWIRPLTSSIVAGGDGTVAKVFRAVSGREMPVAVLALGTANNLARSLGLIGDAQQLASGWTNDKASTFDVGVCCLNGPDGAERLFVEGCGGGIFVEAIERGPKEVEKPGALLGNEHDRALTLIRSVVRDATPSTWRVEVDGVDHSGDYIAVEALNIRFAGPGIPLAAQADSSDGLLDVVLVRDSDREALIDYLDRRLAHHEHAVPHLDVVRGSHVVLDTGAGKVRVDDEVLPVAGVVDITVRPAAVRYLDSRD